MTEVQAAKYKERFFSDLTKSWQYLDYYILRSQLNNFKIIVYDGKLGEKDE